MVWRSILLDGAAAGRAVKLGSDTKLLEHLVPALPLKKLGCRAHRAERGFDRELASALTDACQWRRTRLGVAASAGCDSHGCG